MGNYLDTLKFEIKTQKRIKSKCKLNKKTNCWEWQGAKGNKDGYGRISYKRKTQLAHRVSFEVFKGIPPPKNLQVRHLCHNRLCVNSDHLKLGTYSDNRKDTVKRLKGSPNIQGEKHFNAKLTEDDVRYILYTWEELGGEFGEFSKKEICDHLACEIPVSPLTIRDVIDGITWGHVR